MAPDTRDEFDDWAQALFGSTPEQSMLVKDYLAIMGAETMRHHEEIVARRLREWAAAFRQAQAAKSCATCQSSDSACAIRSAMFNAAGVTEFMARGGSHTFSCSLHVPRAEDGSR